MIFKKKAYQVHFIAIFALFVYLTMVFSFTIGQVMSKSKKWENNLASNITIELPLYTNVSDSVKKVRSINGVKVVKAMSSSDKEQILAEWLDGVDLSKMPVPDILEVKIDTDFEYEKIKMDINKVIVDSKVYSNSYWGKDIFKITKAIFYMCVFLMSLIILVSVILINFMVKSILHTYNREINILHLNGASDMFISDMIKKNIFLQSLKASLVGAILFNVTVASLVKVFGMDYGVTIYSIVKTATFSLLVSMVAAALAKFNVEKELRS
ncbi:MAG: hypothetical protein OIF36_02095 [Alphaproteobacteria bacterium]|nr:hypothetical protein [Alphaproteobacteria bacterium]